MAEHKFNILSGFAELSVNLLESNSDVFFFIFNLGVRR